MLVRHLVHTRGIPLRSVGWGGGFLSSWLSWVKWWDKHIKPKVSLQPSSPAIWRQSGISCSWLQQRTGGPAQSDKRYWHKDEVWWGKKRSRLTLIITTNNKQNKIIKPEEHHSLRGAVCNRCNKNESNNESDLKLHFTTLLLLPEGAKTTQQYKIQVSERLIEAEIIQKTTHAW